MGSANVKIVGRRELLAQVTDARRRGRVVVLCHGCFDIVHPGHIRHLEFAREHGDVLVVTITGDAAIDKGSDRPYIPQELRAENLAALEVVDWVHIDPHHTAADLLENVRPDVYVKGQEYQRSTDPRFRREQAIVEGYGGRVVFSSGDVVFSSTALLQKMGRAADVEDRRLQYLCTRHTVQRSPLRDIVRAGAGRRVVVIGDTVFDRYVFCDAIDVADEAPMMSLRELEQQRFPGGAAVVARHLAALGADVVLISSFGRDAASDEVLDVLSSEGIATVPLLSRDRTVVKTRFLVERTKVLKVEDGGRVPLDTRSEIQAAELILERAGGAAAAIFCDYGYGTLTDGLLARVMAPLREAVEFLSADVSGLRRSLLNFRRVDLFCPTERELRATLHNFNQGLSHVAWELLEHTQARHLIATLGRRGLVAFERQAHDRTARDWDARLHSEYLQAFNSNAIDPMGCGDALLAGATLALCAGANLIQAAYLGNMMAALEATELGNVPISAPRLLAMMDARPELEPAPAGHAGPVLPTP